MVELLGFKVNNSIYLISWILQIYFLNKVFNRKINNWYPAMLVIYLAHLYNLYIYQNYHLETYWFLIFDILLLLSIEREIKISKSISRFLMFFSLYVIIDFISRVFIVFDYYELFYKLVYFSDIFAILFLLAPYFEDLTLKPSFKKE